MSVADYVIYEDTRRPDLTATLKGTGLDAASISSVKFRMRSVAGGALKVDQAGSIVDSRPNEVDVRYAWDADDLDTAGLFRGWWLVTFTDGTTAIFPSRKTYVIEIKAAP